MTAKPIVEAKHRPRIIVKFGDDVVIPYDESATAFIRSNLDDQGLLKPYPDLKFEPFLGPEEEMRALMTRAMEMDPTYQPPNFLVCFAVAVPEGADTADLRATLSQLKGAERVYLEPAPEEPPMPPPVPYDPLEANQGYLEAAPSGIDARFAWSQPGGSGEGVALVDLEQGWTLQHEDLRDRRIDLHWGVNRQYFYHGTAVLGIIAAVHNTVGVLGIAHGIRYVGCVSQWRADGAFSTMEAIRRALTVLAPGDVLLLETQLKELAEYKQVPAELEWGVFVFVRLATALGIVVVAAAGNGRNDLDTVHLPLLGDVLNRRSPYFLDSYAIMVGAATWDQRSRPDLSSNYGSRIDCFAWGEAVATPSSDLATGTNLSRYTLCANGTSAAAAIVAGGAILVQSAAEARFGRRYRPWALRGLLSDPSNTSSFDPASDQIGVMPDLKNIIGNLMTKNPP